MELQKTKRKIFSSTGNTTNLVYEMIEDPKGVIVSYTMYVYDERGNVEEEYLCGNLTGNESALIQLDDKGFPIGSAKVHQHVKKRTYSNDGFNLLLTQGDSKEGKISYAYKKGTDLLSSKFIYRGTELKKRFFYDYDDNGVLVRQTTDDGAREDTTSRRFSEQHIVEWTVSKEYPIGLPLQCTEKYFDKTISAERVFKTFHQAFDTQGRLLLREWESTSGEKKIVGSWRYDEHDNLIEERNDKGSVVTYSYNDKRLLSCKKSAKVNETFFYDHKGRLNKRQETYPSGALFEETFEYDEWGNKIIHKDMFDASTFFTYDSFNRVTSIACPEIYEKGVLVRPMYRYVYDSFGRISTSIDPKGQSTHFSYNVRGNPTRIEYPDGSRDRFVYDSEGTLHRKAAKEGIVEIYVYDFLGRLNRVEQFEQSSTGPGQFLYSRDYCFDTFHLIDSYDERHYNLKYSYNSLGQMIQIEAGTGWKKNEQKPKVCFTYDSFGRIASFQEWFGEGVRDFFQTFKKYDACDRIIEERKEDADGQKISTKVLTYDTCGNLLSQEVNGVLVEQIEYNERHEPVMMKDAFGNRTLFSHNYKHRNDKGQIVYTHTCTDPSGMKKIYSYDSREALLSYMAEDSQGRLLEKREFSYDALKNISEEQNAVCIDGIVSRIQSTQYSYDSMNRVLSIEENEGSEKRKTSFEYNAKGQLKKRYEPGSSAPILYNFEFGQDVTIKYPSLKPDALSGEYEWMRLSFAADGSLTTARSSEGVVVSRIYGYFNQILEEQIEAGYRGSYTYTQQTDALGRTTCLTLPDASRIQYVYDKAFLKEVVRESSDRSRRYRHEYVSYDASNKPKEELLIGQLGAKTVERDVGGRTTQIVSTFYKEHIASNGYDPLGNILQVQKEAQQGSVACSFSYNALSQLTSEKGCFTHSYSYDSLGNHTAIDKTSSVIAPFNTLSSIQSIGCTYDLRGRLSKKKFSKDTWEFSYNALGWMTRVKKNNEEKQFLYDGLGRRIIQQQTKDGRTVFEFFLYFNEEEIGLLTSQGKIKQLKVPGLENSIAIELEKEVYAPLYDAQNNIICLVDPQSREVVESYEYSVFGEERVYNQESDLVDHSLKGNPWRFSGKRKDDISCLIFFGVRDYDPLLKKWTTPDPAGAIDGPNVYTYTKNNPLKYQDTLGFSSHHYYAIHESFDAYMATGRHENGHRGGDFGPIEAKGTPDYPVPSSLTDRKKHRRGNFVELYSIKYSKDQIIEKLKNEPDFSRKVICHINGINTSSETVYNRAHNMIKNSKQQIAAVLIAYNSTNGIIADVGEAYVNLQGIGLKVTRDLHRGLIDFLDNFRGSPQPKIAFHCHSQGAAIMSCLLRKEDFSVKGEYRRNFGKIFTYGGAKLLPEAHTNYLDYFDLIPALDGNNIFTALAHPSHIKFTSFRLHSPLEAHSFEGASYQEAFAEAISIR